MLPFLLQVKRDGVVEGGIGEIEREKPIVK